MRRRIRAVEAARRQFGQFGQTDADQQRQHRGDPHMVCIVQVSGHTGVTPLREEFVTPAPSPQLLERSGIALNVPADLAKLPLIEMEQGSVPAQAGGWPGCRIGPGQHRLERAGPRA